ncbi:hypothetical protein Fcan01_23008 [Folsomia candida]|uniref:Uncharacterized protein n=1 Tax=Folsomia candida TaxID=158441 RepID=A0A226D9S3_FOLCA|nr:hypothetical protein Fcan01_23008 [Folsomia candida]
MFIWLCVLLEDTTTVTNQFCAMFTTCFEKGKISTKPKEKHLRPKQTKVFKFKEDALLDCGEAEGKLLLELKERIRFYMCSNNGNGGDSFKYKILRKRVKSLYPIGLRIGMGHFAFKECTMEGKKFSADLILHGDSPIGFCLLVQYFYGDHFPIPYQLPYTFFRWNRILHVEIVPMKSAVSKFVSPFISLGLMIVCTAVTLDSVSLQVLELTVGLYCHMRKGPDEGTPHNLQDYDSIKKMEEKSKFRHAALMHNEMTPK